MAARISDEEWERLSSERFEAAALLRAVDAVDELRGNLNDGDYATSPQLRTDLLRLHRLAMAVIKEGSRGQVGELFDLAIALEDRVLGMMTLLEHVEDTLLELTALYPESLTFNGNEDE